MVWTASSFLKLIFTLSCDEKIFLSLFLKGSKEKKHSGHLFSKLLTDVAQQVRIVDIKRV